MSANKPARVTATPYSTDAHEDPETETGLWRVYDLPELGLDVICVWLQTQLWSKAEVWLSGLPFPRYLWLHVFQGEIL